MHHRIRRGRHHAGIIHRFNVTAPQAGMLTGIFALVVSVFGPFLVLLLSGFNRKTMLQIALAVFTLSSLGSAFVTNFNVLLGVRMIPALLHPVYFSLAFVSAISLYRKEEAAKASSLVFLGTTIGIVLGVPITTYIASTFSYEAAFYFTAAVNALSFFGVLLLLPQMPASNSGSSGQQMNILKKPTLWLNIASTGLIFAGMFAAYSYAAEYLKTVAGMSNSTISALLVLFGLGGVAGNMLAGKFIGRNMIATVIVHPILIVGALLLVMSFQQHVTPMIVIMIFWGAVHTSSLVITQIWLTSEAPEAPEFATSLFASFANLGIAVGAAVGGKFINLYGLPGMFTAALLFLGAGLALILIRVWMQKPRAIEVNQAA
ncbi:MFS transporter [Paraburkholderia sp. MMS20-SJTR3]|uniref:MFS transporter n=2 Tax=Paraburkholderia sejongensis TaxID=2886946 RepID=A0ABS8K3W0_9BURK|nr:MFS transporter [Paraburkholderia sp. MMS20-SJTR3]